MPKHRTHSIEFKRQVVQDYLGGETLYGLAKRHEISRTLIRVWLAKHGLRGSMGRRGNHTTTPRLRAS